MSGNTAKDLSSMTQKFTSLKNMDKHHAEFLEKIMGYWYTRNAKEEDVDQNGTYATSIDLVLGRFLLTLLPKLSMRGIKFLLYFGIAFC